MDTDSINIDIGRRIRNHRNRNGLTQQELADRTFKDEEEQVVFTEKEYFEKLDEQGNSRQWIVPTAQRFQMEPLLVVIQPHSSLEEDKPHNGEEFGYLMSGRLNLWLGDKVYHIKSGESFYYQASQKHRIENPGSRPAKFLWISTPPEF